MQKYKQPYSFVILMPTQIKLIVQDKIHQYQYNEQKQIDKIYRYNYNNALRQMMATVKLNQRQRKMEQFQLLCEQKNIQMKIHQFIKEQKSMEFHKEITQYFQQKHHEKTVKLKIQQDAIKHKHQVEIENYEYYQQKQHKIA